MKRATLCAIRRPEFSDIVTRYFYSEVENMMKEKICACNALLDMLNFYLRKCDPFIYLKKYELKF